MKKRLQGFILFFLLSMAVHAQEIALKGSIEPLVVNMDTIPLDHYSSMKKILPNRPIHIIVSDIENYSEDQIQNEYKMLGSLEEWHLVYLRLDSEKINSKNLAACLDELFYQLFYDRNRVHLSIRETIELEELKRMDTFLKDFASLRIESNTYESYGEKSGIVYPLGALNAGEDISLLKSENEYAPITIKEMEYLGVQKKRTDNYIETKGKHLVSFTSGFFQVGRGRAAALDEETLVDLRNFNWLWTLSYNYLLSNRVGVGFVFGFSAKQDGSSSSIINGGVSGGAISKLGLSTRYLAYKTQRLNVYPELSFGNLNARIGGGSASIQSTVSGVTTTIDSEQSSQRSPFLEFRLGADYRLGRNIFIRGNLIHSRSSFDQNFGSVSGFSGTGIDFGIGLIF